MTRQVAMDANRLISRAPSATEPSPLGGLTAEQVIRILEGVREINAEGSLDAQLALIARITTELAECERCSVFLMDAEKRELWSKVATGLSDQEIRVPLGRGIAGTVAETNTLANIADAYADPRFNPEVDRQTGFRTRNLLVVPVTNRQREVVGVLQLLNKRDGKFSTADEALLTVFAAQVAIAIQNVQRLEEFRATDHQLKQAIANVRIRCHAEGAAVGRSVGGCQQGDPPLDHPGVVHDARARSRVMQ